MDLSTGWISLLSVTPSSSFTPDPSHGKVIGCIIHKLNRFLPLFQKCSGRGIPSVKFVELPERFSRYQGRSGVFLPVLTFTMTAKVRKTSVPERALSAQT